MRKTKKAIALLICAAAFLLMPAGCAAKTPNITFTGTIEEIYDASILVTADDEAGFDKALVSFEDGIKISFNFLVGQVVKLTILPQIRESYPVQVTAVAVELVSEPASPDPAKADYTASFFRADSKEDGGWDFITAWAVNADTLAISSVRHIPVVAVDNTEALSDFISEGIHYFQFDTAYDDSMSFTENAGKYDEAFFEKSTLLILSAQERSGSIRHKITDAAISGETLSVAVETIVPETGTDDMADWFILLEIDNGELPGVTMFDAYYK